MGTANVPHQLAMASGKPGIAARFNVLAVFLVLPVTALLIYTLGFTGAALSWVWYHTAGYIYVVPKVCRQCCDFAARVWYKHISKVFGAIAVTYGVAWGILALFSAPSIPALAVAYAAATIVYGAIAWLMIRPKLKGTIRGHALRLSAFFQRTRSAIGDDT